MKRLIAVEIHFPAVNPRNCCLIKRTIRFFVRNEYYVIMNLIVKCRQFPEAYMLQPKFSCPVNLLQLSVILNSPRQFSSARDSSFRFDSSHQSSAVPSSHQTLFRPRKRNRVSGSIYVMRPFLSERFEQYINGWCFSKIVFCSRE